MIFDNNTTALGSSLDIPMAEGYDCSYGCAKALLDSAENDYAMFREMLNVEARDLQLQKTGYVQEEVVALQEATIGGIWSKIKELFTKLIAKVKSIFHTFMSKLNGLFMKDKQLVKKYEKEILRKSNIGNLEVTWRKQKSGKDAATGGIDNTVADIDFKWDGSYGSNAQTWNDDDTQTDRVESYLKEIVSDTDVDSFEKDYIDSFLEDEDTDKISNFGGIRGVISYLKDSAKTLKGVETGSKKLTQKLEKLVKEADKKANEKANQYSTAEKELESNAKEELDKANHAFEYAKAYEAAQLKVIAAGNKVAQIWYKQNKAAFMKAIAASDKKLEESAYLDAVEEAAADSVTDVIERSFNSVDLSVFNAASDNVIDGDVSDDYNKLTYGKDCYTAKDSYSQVGSQGTVNSTIVGKQSAKKEAAFFGERLY